MNINIPDKISKLFVLIGIILIGFSYFKQEKIEKEYFDKIDQYNILNDSTEIGNLIIDNELKTIKRDADNLSRRYDVKNPISETDSVVTFTQTISGSKNELIVSDSINKEWIIYTNKKFQHRLRLKKDEQLEKKLKSEKDLRNSYDSANNKVIIFGILIFFVGILAWMFDEGNEDKQTIIKQTEKLYVFCQSCGKTFSSMRRYGNENDGNENYAFCKECYDQGQFTNPELTKEDVLTKAMELYKKRNWFLKKNTEGRIKKLERWIE